MQTPQDALQHAWISTTQIVLIAEKGTRSFPAKAFDASGNFHDAEVMKRATKEALEALEGPDELVGRLLGYATFGTRGMTSYMFTVYTIVNGRVVETGHARYIDEVEQMVESQHAQLQGTEDELAARLDTELGRHDWYAHMAEGSAWAGADSHLIGVIRPLLAALPEERGLAIWQKHAPEGYSRNPYA